MRDQTSDGVWAGKTVGRSRETDAVDLGWRLAALYAEAAHLSPARPLRPPQHADGYLPAVQGLPDGDKLELYVRGAASVARRIGADDRACDIEALMHPARGLLNDSENVNALQAQLYECHTTLTKELWAGHETDGKAFELGTSLFDTWHRVAGARGDHAKRLAWKDVFGHERVERVKVLLDDLESRLSSVAVTVVRAHLDRWRSVMAQWPLDGAPSNHAEQQLHSQVVTWRQLLTEDKEPEAFLTCRHRRRLHREFSWLVSRSFLRPAPILCTLLIAGVAAALMFGGPGVSDAARLLLAPLGAIGLSKASLTILARDRLHTWITLLWNRAMATVLFRATCFDDALIPKHACRGPLAHLRRLAATVTRRLPLPTVVAPRPLPSPEL